MTEYEASASSSSTPRPLGSIAAVSGILDRPVKAGRCQRVLQTHHRLLAAHFARALLGHSTLEAKRAQGRPGADLAPAVRCAKGSARKPHSSIQVAPITRPSLRSGWTAYAALSREPNSLWPPSRLRKSPAARRLTRLPHSQTLDRSDDGQDHTVLPYARPTISPQFFQPCRRSRKLADETKPSSAAHPARSLGLTESNPPCPHFSRPTLPRPPQARLATVTTQDRPSW
ncbi:hypothetical protein M2189_000397 [Bradyrhizobium japonicum]|nr:hypothetical protein [Bradyrhizobium japonicum]MCS3957194.1 hypothetical protein [Bradyrhizobium japonicum]MCS3998943.1 hypothetical protein [Bradyrhizobium japonicum]